MGIRADQYYDQGQFHQWLLWMLYASLVVQVGSLKSTMMELNLLARLSRGEFESQEDLLAASSSNDLRESVIGWVSIAIFVVVGVQALMWIYRCAHNARVRAPTMEAPAASVGWYFVPIANFWKPYGAMKEIWQRSLEQAGRSVGEFRGLLIAWWATWIISAIVGRITWVLGHAARDLDSLRAADMAIFASGLIGVPLYLIFITMVKRLHSIQVEAWSRRPRGQVLDSPAAT